MYQEVKCNVISKADALKCYKELPIPGFNEPQEKPLGQYFEV